MFDVPGVDLADLADVDDAALVGAIEGWARAEAAAAGRRLAAIAELVQRRCGEPDATRAHWACDDWDAAAAEVAAALGLTQRRASTQMHIGQSLRQRLPKLAALLTDGLISTRIAATISWRTLLVEDTAIAAVDTELAAAAHRFGRLSETKLERTIDACISAYDPDALRRTRQAARSREVIIRTGEDDAGTASVFARLFAHDAATLQRRLQAMTTQVCPADPRTNAQRRADALGALAAGAEHLTCACTTADCPTTPTTTKGRGTGVVIHVLADTAALHTPRDPNLHGDPTTPTQTPAAAPAVPAAAPAAVILGGPALPAPLLAELIHTGATITALQPPGEEPEPGYRPSPALAAFIRARDMTCRFPGCEVPAELCDIDHTIPWPHGPTHAFNLSCKCRKHHLLKTFWTGPDGWTDHQLPDGRLIWRSPSGHTYTTHPGSHLLIPTTTTAPPTEPHTTPSPAPDLPPAHNPCTNRTLMMPTRRRTRTQDHAQRIKHERALNTARIRPPPF